MSERKVLNKYFPPDFDPTKIPRKKASKQEQHKVRLMAPFSMQCNTCGDYIYKGKKFNARKERADGENYLGIQIFRFYIRCPKCAAEITFKTDPQNTDYVAEHGALRNFEPWRDESSAIEAMKAEKEAAEENNPMKALENRTLASKREMDILDALDEIRTKNAQLERKDVNQVLKSNGDQAKLLAQLQDEEDARAAREAFYGSVEIDGDIVDDEVLEEIEREAPRPNSTGATTAFDTPFPPTNASNKRKSSSLLGLIVKKGKTEKSVSHDTTAVQSTTSGSKPPLVKVAHSSSSGFALVDYGSDSD